MVRKGGFEPPRLSAPPPQDGVSASSTTSAMLRRFGPLRIDRKAEGDSEGNLIIPNRGHGCEMSVIQAALSNPPQKITEGSRAYEKYGPPSGK